MSRGNLAFLCVSACLILGSVGMTAPISPYLVARFVSEDGAQAWHNSALFTVYNLCAFLAIPTLGALSDRRGRKPILAWCLLGSAVGYAYFALAQWLGGLYLSRLLDGITGGNIAILFASMSDQVPKEERVRYFGILGACSGMGFVVGPALGTVASMWGGETAPPLLAALLCLANCFWCLLGFRETLKAPNLKPMTWRDINPLGVFHQVQVPGLRPLLLCAFFVMVPFAVLQSNITVLAKQHLGWLPAEASKLFLVVGVVNITVQGAFLPRLRGFSERFLVVLGLLFMMSAFVLIGVAYRQASSAFLYSAIALFALGNSLQGPALTSWISSLGDADQQGGLQGANQSVQALARVVGPLLGGWAYQKISPASPYQAGLVVFLLALLVLLPAGRKPSEKFQGHPVSSK